MTANTIAAKTTDRPVGTIRLADFLPYRLGALGHRLTVTESDLGIVPFAITLPEWKVLAIVADRGPIMPVDIRRLGTQPKATVSRLVARLLELGLLGKRAKAGDGRTFEVFLTEQGWRVYGMLVPRARRLEARIAQALSPRECDELERLIGKIEAALEK